MAEENGVFRVLQRLYRLGQRVVQLSVHRPGADPDGPPNIMHVMEDTPLCQARADAQITLQSPPPFTPTFLWIKDSNPRRGARVSRSRSTSFGSRLGLGGEGRISLTREPGQTRSHPRVSKQVQRSPHARRWIKSVGGRLQLTYGFHGKARWCCKCR